MDKLTLHYVEQENISDTDRTRPETFVQRGITHKPMYHAEPVDTMRAEALALARMIIADAKEVEPYGSDYDAAQRFIEEYGGET